MSIQHTPPATVQPTSPQSPKAPPPEVPVEPAIELLSAPASGNSEATRPTADTSSDRAGQESASARRADITRRARRTPERASLEEALIRAVAEAATQRLRLAREMKDLPPPLDTRLALLASVAEIRTAIVPPSLTTLDRRR